MTSRFKTALDVQDAGNLSGIARSFVTVVDEAYRDTRSTKGVWEDPAVRLFAEKIYDLCFRQGNEHGELLTYCKAYDACCDAIKGAEIVNLEDRRKA